MKKTIIFGGTGWVGHYIALEFHKAGYETVICSRGQKSTYNDYIPKEIAIIHADKQNEADIASIASDEYEIVVDSVPTEQSIDNIAKHFCGVKRYLHCSSTGGYAPLAFVPGDETMPYDHFMGGWKQKDIVDSKVLALWQSQKFPATVIRPPYITGPGLLPLDNFGGRRQDFITDILNGKVLDVANDGQSLLQPIHVADLAKSFLLAAEHPVSVGQIYNICLEKAVTINRYLEINASAFGIEAKINYMSIEDILKKYNGDVDEVYIRFLSEHMCYDISKARNDLGYSPHCTTEEAIVETALWAKEQIVK